MATIHLNSSPFHHLVRWKDGARRRCLLGQLQELKVSFKLYATMPPHRLRVRMLPQLNARSSSTSVIKLPSLKRGSMLTWHGLLRRKPSAKPTRLPHVGSTKNL